MGFEAGRQVALGVGRKARRLELISLPVPHVVVESRKELHGWWSGKRECTSERLLVNPYNGCSIDCFYCYTKALPGYFNLFRREGVVTVFRDFDREVARQLDSLKVASAGYFSPVTDPFQPLNRIYRLTEKIMSEFVRRNLPVEFITKEKVSDEALDIMSSHPCSFGQVSITTPHEELRQRLSSGGASTTDLLENILRVRDRGLHAVLRIDPIIPHITDARNDLTQLIRLALDHGATHVVASVMDIPASVRPLVFKEIESRFGRGMSRDISALYVEKIGASYHTHLPYRMEIFQQLRSFCDRMGVTFSLCMEYEKVNGKAVGLNKYFMSSTNCEGFDVPIYRRVGRRFEPAAPCSGACLNCSQAVCGVPELAMGKRTGGRNGFTLADYRRWGRELGSSGVGGSLCGTGEAGKARKKEPPGVREGRTRK